MPEESRPSNESKKTLHTGPHNTETTGTPATIGPRKLSRSRVNALLAGAIVGTAFWLGVFAWFAAWLLSWSVPKTIAVVEVVYLGFAALRLPGIVRALRRASK